MKLEDLKSLARDAISVHKVFGEPVERDGVTVVPAARIGGGGGAVRGHDERGEEGEGGGFGLGGAPAGVYVIKDGKVRWLPAVDVNRLFFVAGAVAVAYLMTRRAVAKTSRRHGPR
jgi:uncharacterized spore protein YtfJ